MLKKPYYQLSPEETLKLLNTNKDGLTKDEVELRQKIYGKNILKKVGQAPALFKFFKQFKDALIILLIISTFISLYLQDYRGATILGIIVILNAVIGYIQEAKAEKIMESLKKMINPIAKVKRNGKLIEENAENLVLGDIVYLEEGENVPADLRIIEESNFQTNDFSLTGESNPVNKFTHAIGGDVSLSEKNNSVFMGTNVATGYCRGVVIGTGMNTELGRIANLSVSTIYQTTPLQKEMSDIAKKLIIGTIILGVILVAVALLANFTLKEAFIFAVGLAAAMVPQGLPAQVSVALTSASGRLAKNNALVKQLASVETLGCVNIICTDKTGTLTKNEMTVKNIYLGGQIYEITGSGYQPIGTIQKPLKNKFIDFNPKYLSQFVDSRKHFFYAGFLASNAKINPPDEKHQLWYSIGDPTESALVSLAQKVGFQTDKLSDKLKQYHQFGFDAYRKMMSSVRCVDGQDYVYVKGSTRSILDNSTQIFDGKKIRKITKADQDKILNQVEKLASQAMRNLAIAYKPIKKYNSTLKMQEAESDLIFLGFVSIMDPPREEVASAIQAAKDANIKIIIITGDYGLTAQAIAEKIGLGTSKNILIIKGDDLKNKSDIQLTNDLQNNKYIIFSRSSPEDKLRIVNLLKKTDHVVAVTGDGINDAPALKNADIGVAMGKIGTDVAKEASEIVLLDDSFSTLVYAIQQGRIIYQNLRKTILSCITSNGGELFAILMSLVCQVLFGIPIAITPTQILTIDLIGEMGPLTALSRDPAKNDLMHDKPRNIKNYLINKSAIIDLVRSGALMGIIGFLSYILYFVFNGISLKGIDTNTIIYMTGTSITYTSILFCQFANIFSRRAGANDTMFTSYLRSNKKLLFAILISLICMMILIYFKPISSYFNFGAMSLQDRLFPIIGGLVFLLLREGYKFIIINRNAI